MAEAQLVAVAAEEVEINQYWLTTNVGSVT